MVDLKAAVRAIPDFPKPGIVFRDVTTLMGDPLAFSETIDLLCDAYKAHEIDQIAGIEARGFVFGAALAHRLGIGFVPVRKKGKLPGDTYSQTYDLEYGQDTLEMHKDALTQGQRVLMIDDLLATGGTALAALDLVEKAGGKVVGAAFVVDLPELGGRKKLEARGLDVLTLIEFEGH
ncbi:adenine phosphoribosyltransferase [Parvularcula marina]|uniref:adenine phosphoribosyltransferase n=1 Tax=Parvularcula marina TaxID=2292771 RepID=UPI0035173B7B